MKKEKSVKEKRLSENNPERKKRNIEIACLRATGKSVLEIAQEIHVSKATISRALKDEDVKNILDETTKYYATFAPAIRQGFIELCVSPNPDVRQRAIAEYHKVMGMSSSQMSIFIQNMYAQQNNVVLPQHLQELLARGPGEVIDVTPHEDTTKTKAG